MQVSLLLLVSSAALVLLQGCCAAARGWQARKNGATEVFPDYREQSPREPATHATNGSSDTGNRAKSGARSASSVSYSASELSCRELRSTRYVTDGSCRSAKPIKELVCSGQCLPAHLTPNAIGRAKWWRSSTSEYRCVPAHSRTRRVQLRCPGGGSRTYKIRTVTACKCKRFRAHHNQSEAKEVPRRQRARKRPSQGRGTNNTPLVDNSY